MKIKPRNQELKRKIYWLAGENDDQSKVKVDDLIIADGPTASGKIVIFLYLKLDKKWEHFLLQTKAFLFTYLLSNLSEDKRKVLGLTGTKSEYTVCQNNGFSSPNSQESLTTIRNNYLYLIENLNGKTYLVCQLFNQLKSNEAYDWIDQVSGK